MIRITALVYTPPLYLCITSKYTQNPWSSMSSIFSFTRILYNEARFVTYVRADFEL